MTVEILIILLIPLIFIGILFSSYKKVEAGKILIINGMRGFRTSFSGTLVIPILEKHEILDTTIKDLKVDLKGDNGLLLKDNHIVDISANFYIRINPEIRDIQMVVTALGTEKASSLHELEKMFIPKFSAALITIATRFSFEDLKHNLEEYKMEVLQMIGMDMNGFVLDDVAINYIPTSVRKLEIK
jgi:uncharacterized membrane protein YqiK